MIELFKLGGPFGMSVDLAPDCKVSVMNPVPVRSSYSHCAEVIGECHVVQEGDTFYGVTDVKPIPPNKLAPVLSIDHEQGGPVKFARVTFVYLEDQPYVDEGDGFEVVLMREGRRRRRHLNSTAPKRKASIKKAMRQLGNALRLNLIQRK